MTFENAGEVEMASPAPLVFSGQQSRLAFENLDLLVQAAQGLMRQARLVDAQDILRTVLQRDPDHVKALASLASLQENLGEIEASVATFDRVIALSPNNPATLGAAIFSMDRKPGATLEDGYHLRRRYNELVGWPSTRTHSNNRAPDRRLRIGYVSGDFRHHSAAVVFGPVVLCHDRDQFEITCYAANVRSDWLTEKLRSGVDRWRDISAMSDDDLETQIRADEIDILVDLSGHSAGNRLPVFARKPAPVQVTAWGYITGTGLDAMDYLFADARTIYPDEERWYSEQIVRLPSIVCYWAADVREVGEVQPPPCLKNGYITYGVFNRLGKLKLGAIELWCRILAAVPDARLVIKGAGLGDHESRRVLQGRFAQFGCDLRRLEFREESDHETHMKAYNDVDVCLDPWPDGGGVSTLEAFWMGVPVVTMPYRQIASRLTSSFAHTLGLPYLVASSPDEYVERAVSLNDQRGDLAGVRSALRQVMSVSPLCDSYGYTAAVEQEYRAMWHRWCAAQNAPASIVEAQATRAAS